MHSDAAPTETPSQTPIAAMPRAARLRRLASESRREEQLLAALAHELRNLLAPLDTALELVELGRDDPLTVDRALPVARRQVKKLCELAADLVNADAPLVVRPPLLPEGPPAYPAAIRVTRP